MKGFFSTLLFFLILLTGNVHAEEVIPYGDWTFVQGDSYKNIHTINQNNLEFGYSCSRDCIFYISPALVCQMGKITDGWMIQSTGVGIKVKTMCVTNEDLQVLKIYGRDEIIKILKSNQVIHFLINFDVQTNSLLSFDLVGFKDSYTRIEK